MPLLRLPSELWGSDQSLITGCKGCSLPVASPQGHYAEAEPLYKRALRIAGGTRGALCRPGSTAPRAAPAPRSGGGFFGRVGQTICYHVHGGSYCHMGGIHELPSKQMDYVGRGEAALISAVALLGVPFLRPPAFVCPFCAAMLFQTTFCSFGAARHRQEPAFPR